MKRYSIMVDEGIKQEVDSIRKHFGFRSEADAVRLLISMYNAPGTKEFREMMDMVLEVKKRM